MIHTSRNRVVRWLYPNINTRITGPFLLVVAIVAGIGVFIVTRLVAGSLQERFSNQLLDSANAASNSIADIEREQLATLRLMVFTEGMADALVSDDTAQIETLLRPVATNAQIDDVIVFDQNGVGVLQLTRGPGFSLDYTVMGSPPEVAAWTSVQQTLRANPDRLGDKYIDIIDGPFEFLFYISAPVVNEDEQVVGGISVGMRLQRLVELASSQALSSLALYHHNGANLGSTFRGVDSALLLPDFAIVDLLNRTQRESPIIEREASGVSYQVLYVPFHLRSQSVGVMAVGLPTNFIVERIGTSRDTFGILFTALFLLVGAVGILTSRSIIRPVSQLVDTTRAIRSGDLSRRVGLNTPDELGELATSFDHMTAELLTRNEEIAHLYYQQLKETTQRDAVLANIGDAVIVQDPVGVVILRNHTADQLIMAVRQSEKDGEIFNAVRQSPEDYAQPQTVQLAERYYSVQAKPVYLPAGTLVGYVLVFRDITALLASERLKDELILQMSHELRTPLTSARGYLDLVRNFESANLTDQGMQFINGSLNSLDTLQRMTNQVIDVSSIIAERFSVHFTRVNITHQIHDCAKRWVRAAEERNLRLSVTLPPQDIWIHGDAHYLPQMLDYLVSNACNYTLPGGKVELWARPKRDHVAIDVIDSGVGIAPDELDRVFERMYRGQSATAGATDTRGLGLGLYITKHIVEAHHGSITLESKLDQGTTATVRLPVKQDGFVAL